MHVRRTVVLAFLMSVVLAGVAHAQATAVTATDGVEFTDVDHAAVNLDGTPVITRYELRFIPSAGCAAVAPFNGGKPTAGAGGVIRVQPVATFGTLPGNCTYTLTVAAIGPGGEGVSAPTDPFVRVVPKVPAGASKPAVVH